MKSLPVYSIVAALAWGSAIAQPPGGPPPDDMRGGMMREHMRQMYHERHKGYAEVVLKHLGDLKLSDEQVGKITRIHQDNQAALETLGKKLRDSMRSAHELYLNPSSDEASIRKAAKEHNAAVDELVETALKSRNAINAVLTADQLQKLQTYKTAP
jgi:Spy/CpxP family protein refolding chaperone